MKRLIWCFCVFVSVLSIASTENIGGENAKKLKNILLESGAKVEKRPLGSSQHLIIKSVKCNFEKQTEFYTCEISQKNKNYESTRDEAKTLFKLLEIQVNASTDRQGNINLKTKGIVCITSAGMKPKTQCEMTI
jgi:hypothetical protein